MSEQEKTQSSQEPAEGKEQTEAEKKVADIQADTERINQAIAENDNAKARAQMGGVTDAGQSKPTAEQEKQAEAQKTADEIVNAFK